MRRCCIPEIIDNIVCDEFRLSFLTLVLVLCSILITLRGFHLPRRSFIFLIICSYHAVKRLKETCWPLRLSLTRDCSCVIFTFTHTLCGSCIISEDYHNEITVPVWVRDMLFPKSVDIIVCDDFRIFFLTLDHSRVVVPFYLPSWDSSIILEDLLFSSFVLIRP